MKLSQKIISICFITIVSCIGDSMEIINLEKIKTKNESFEVRLIYIFVEELLDQIKFLNFDDFKEIKFWNFNLTRYKYNVFLHVDFIPNKRAVLNLKINENDFKYFSYQVMDLRFYFVGGFDVDKFSLSVNSYQSINLWVTFQISNFILLKDKKAIDESKCTVSRFRNDVYFKNLLKVFFMYGTKYTIETCKFIFKNSVITQIKFSSLMNSVIKKNQLGFVPQQRTTINSTINNAYFNVYKISVNQRLLDTDVFEKVKIFEFNGEISQIDSESFRNLNMLVIINLNILNIRRLFSQGNQWMNSLRNDRISNMSDTTEIVRKLHDSKIIATFFLGDLYVENIDFFNLQKPYFYPDEDFCWFKDFPFDRLVFLDPHMYCVNNCSCTQYWLLQYVYLINKNKIALENFKLSIGFTSPVRFNDYKKEIEKCNFTDRLKKCQDYEFSTKRIDHVSSFQSVFVDTQLVDFIIVILTPILGTLGIIVNVINIITISKIDLSKTPEEKKQKSLIRFMIVYSIINLVYCVIHSLSLMSKCVDLNSIYCSELYFTQFSQWYKIIFVEFMGSNLKTFSNVVYFCISVNRYILLEKESKLANVIKSISDWPKRKKTFWIIFISIILMGLNSHKIIVYKVIDYSITNVSFDKYVEYFFTLPFFLSNSQLYESYWNYMSEKEVHDRSIVYEVFTYINYVLNDVIFYLIFSIIDIFLVIGFKKATQSKKTVYKDNLNDEKVQKLLTDMEQNGKNIMLVIIVNTCILLLIKVFDLSISVSKFTIWKDNLRNMDKKRKLNAFCYTSKICSVYEELVKIAYMLHYSFSIISFYFLNKNFKVNLKNTLCRKNIKNKTVIQEIVKVINQDGS